MSPALMAAAVGSVADCVEAKTSCAEAAVGVATQKAAMHRLGNVRSTRIFMRRE